MITIPTIIISMVLLLLLLIFETQAVSAAPPWAWHQALHLLRSAARPVRMGHDSLGQMSNNLNSLKGGYTGDYIGDYYWGH